MIRLGLVGVGTWGRRYLHAIAQRSDCRLVAVARRTPLQKDDSLSGLRVVGDWRELLGLGREAELDAVIVATHPENQAEVALAAAERGFPALVEKPLGLSAASARRVREAQARAARPSPLLVNTLHVWSPAFLALKARVAAAGGARAVERIESQGANRGPFRSYSSLYDYGVHDLSMALEVLGASAEFVLHAARKLPPEVPEGELYEAELELAQARVKFVVGSGAAHKSRRFAVQLRGGRTLVYDDAEPIESKVSDGGTSVPVPSTPPLDAALSHFLAQVAAFETGALSPQAARASVELAERTLVILDAIDVAARAAYA